MGKPSVIDPMIPWRDYFAINRVLENEMKGHAVIGAVDPKGAGNDYPVAMEVIPSFSMPNHAVIHTRVTPQKFKTLRKIMSSGDVAPFAEELGYDLILWGPVEKKLWGSRVERRFIDEGELVAQRGAVKLYYLKDKLRDRLSAAADLTSADFYFRAAKEFGEERWFQESLGYYYRAVELDPKHRSALLGLAGTLDKYDRKEEALFYKRQALALSATTPE